MVFISGCGGSESTPTVVDSPVEPPTPTASAAPAEVGGQPSAGESKYRGNWERTGEYNTGSITGFHEVKWKKQLPGPVYSVPVAAGDLLYLASEDSNLYALDVATGGEKSLFASGAAPPLKGMRAAPAIVDGRVYFTGADEVFH